MRHDHVPRHSLPCRRGAELSFALLCPLSAMSVCLHAVLHLQVFTKGRALGYEHMRVQPSSHAGTCGLWSVL